MAMQEHIEMSPLTIGEEILAQDGWFEFTVEGAKERYKDIVLPEIPDYMQRDAYRVFLKEHIHGPTGRYAKIAYKARPRGETTGPWSWFCFHQLSKFDIDYLRATETNRIDLIDHYAYFRSLSEPHFEFCIIEDEDAKRGHVLT